MSFIHAKARHLRLGRRGENAACRYLRHCYCDILLRNYRNEQGEIDIIALDGHTLSFIEVKTRRKGGSSRPAAGLSRAQQRRIYRAAMAYLREIGRPQLSYRFDLIEAIFGDFDLCELRHWRRHIQPPGKTRDHGEF